MSIQDGLMFDEALDLIQRWQVFSRATFQKHMQVGSVTRDRLLLELEDYHYVTRASRDRNRFIVSELCWHDSCSLPRGHKCGHGSARSVEAVRAMEAYK